MQTVRMRRLSADELGYLQLLLNRSFQPGVRLIERMQCLRSPNTFIHSTASHSALLDLINNCCQPRKVPTYNHHETITTPGHIKVFAVSIIIPEEKAEGFRDFPVTAQMYGLFRENMACLGIIWPYVRKMWWFEG